MLAALMFNIPAPNIGNFFCLQLDILGASGIPRNNKSFSLEHESTHGGNRDL
jgi:hypothetical protein